MSASTVTVEAVFENGLLRPLEALPLAQNQHVQITIRVPAKIRPWPKDVAAIYQETMEEDRRLAEAMVPLIRETWPKDEDQS
jgi:predicted DNA-binding antitoxin AbrB/MazE fold protein